MEEKLKLTDPRELLKKGYSITLKDGKPLTSIENIAVGTTLTTILFDGSFESQVLNTKN